MKPRGMYSYTNKYYV